MRSLAIALGVAGLVAAGAAHRAHADEAKDDTRAFSERCANRLAIAFTGKAASPTAMAAPDAKLAVDGLLASDDFRERFARFVNSELNAAPGATPLEDASYHVALRVLAEGRPWSDMFLGKFRLASVLGHVVVQDDPEGLGYFRSPDWTKRYEGNEEHGTKLATAYRILNNVVGLRLSVSAPSPNVDQSATGRHASPCNSCHFDGWYALDKVAAVLPLKGQAFDAYKGGPKEMLGGMSIGNDAELVDALVKSKNFSVAACRLSFRFLYAREDNRCDGPVLDRCVDTFESKKTIQSALASIAREPAFCE